MIKQKSIAPKEPWYNAGNNRIFLEKDAERYSQKAAALVITELQNILHRKKQVVLVPSSGRSPKRLYEILTETSKDSIDWKRVIAIQMDEYWGLSSTDSASMEYSVEREFVRPLGVGRWIRYFGPDGKLMRSLDAYEESITALGGIDIVIQGFGRNGHIGFNEPGTPWDSRTRKVRLTDSTLEANIDDPARRQQYRYGVTLGLGVMTRSRYALLLITGGGKNHAVRQFLTGQPGLGIPAHSLSVNPRVDCMIHTGSVPVILP